MCLLTCKIKPKKHILASHPVIVKTTIGLVSWWNEQHLVPRACNLCGKCRPPHSRCVKESFTEKHFKLVPLTGWKLSDFTQSPSYTREILGSMPLSLAPLATWWNCPNYGKVLLPPVGRSHKWTETYWNNKALRHAYCTRSSPVLSSVYPVNNCSLSSICVRICWPYHGTSN